MKKLSILIYVALLSGCEILGSINNGLSNQHSGSVDPHQADIRNAINNIDGDKAIKNAAREASPNIYGFLQTESCINGYDASPLNKYAAPGVTFPRYNYTKTPVPQTRYHNKSTCMNIKNISGLKMPAKNALYFDVVYISGESGEAVKTHHTLIKQNNGSWLFKN